MTAIVTRWWWVRHAPVTENEGRIYGAADLNCVTDDAAAFSGLADLLPEKARLVTSHLKRTRQTADAIRAAGLALPEPLVEPDIGEQSFGDWQGKHHAELQTEEAFTGHHFWLCPGHFRPPGGESFADLIARTAPAIERLSDDHPDGDIVAVGHGGTIRAALALALGLDAEGALAFTIDNLSVTRLDRIVERGSAPDGHRDRRMWRVVMVNRAPHA
ncbi:histidine phosphatase family protein [Marivibrio halodurans]|uniref:Histidine phosphatase family protein n=1 Tax=Marivibrio halodurans TaxID=2039722 RepID=A0A8J7V3C8_9PROT|nr:histidine phosphatase family protein [Marivibrio halodurans]MBP5858101.1 histidine phosphatase family protein [Marivibrio halodurans]